MELLKSNSFPQPPALDTLGMPQDTLATLRSMLAADSWAGLRIITSPDPSKRTALLYALLTEQAGPYRTIVIDHETPFSLPPYAESSLATDLTLDNFLEPLEEPMVAQISVEAREYAHAILLLLRCNPDLLALGDVPDAHAAQLVNECVHTGHRVYVKCSETNADTALARLAELSQSAVSPQYVLAWGDSGFDFRAGA
jgi:type IV secretory pathway ATPase VirB11/archaellum biosynthesis ATPase